MQEIAGELLAHDRVGGGVLCDHAGDGLVPGGIERLAERAVARDAVPFQDPAKLALHELHALDHARGVAALARRLERAVEVVEDRNQVAQQRLVGVLEVFLAVALGAAADIVGFGERAEEPVLFLVELPPEGLDVRQRRLRPGCRRAVHRGIVHGG